MIIAVTVDDHMGMTFNKRRQSRDSAVCKDLLDSASEKLRMNEYSAKLFEPDERIAVSENFLDEAGANDICFVENLSVAPYVSKAEKIIIYRWNRAYPCQTYFDVDMSAFRLTETTEFVGTSHEKITKETYTR